MEKYNKHIFICENKRPENHSKGSCHTSGSGNLRKLFKNKINANNLQGKVRSNSAGCFDACQHGPVVIIYPDNIWYGNVTDEDVDEIFEMSILGNGIVKRLEILNKK